jgi:integrase
MLILMAVSTGARRSELINLRWQDIDFDQQTAYLGDTKNGDRRILPLIDDVIPELKKYREIGKGWVFPHRMNPKYPFQCFDGHWYKALKQSGVKVRFHGLRHTAGSWLANNGETATAIQQLLGLACQQW